MITKLTLSIDDAVIANAKKYSKEKSDKRISQIG
jgi:hypothetical protein